MIEGWSPEEFCRRLKDRDEGAWKVLYEELLRLAKHRWNLDEDVVHAAVVRLLLALDNETFDAEKTKSGSPVPWAVKTASRIAIDSARRLKREVLTDDFEAVVESDVEGLLDLLETQRKCALIEEAIQSLPPSLRAVIEVTYYSDPDSTLTAEQVAQRLSMSIDAVKATKHRALVALREYMRRRQETIRVLTTQDGKPRGRPKGSGKKQGMQAIQQSIQEAQL